MTPEKCVLARVTVPDCGKTGIGCPGFRRFQYNVDGEVIARRSPEGCVVQNLYGRDAVHASEGPRRSRFFAVGTYGVRATRVRQSTRDRAARCAEHPRERGQRRWSPTHPITRINEGDIATCFTYESAFQRPASQSDPRTTTSVYPAIAARTTDYQYDY